MESKEKRAAKRMDIDVRIKLNELYNGETDVSRKDELEVGVTNVSRYGMAFVTTEDLNINSFYDAKMILWTKERIDSIIEIVRKEKRTEEEFLYGCKFIGMVSADMMKIKIYEIISEQEGQ